MTPRIDGPADGNPFALDKLLAFAESKPADEAYDFYDHRRCAIMQWVRATSPVASYRDGHIDLPGDGWVSPHGHHYRTTHGVAMAYPHTFGAFAVRLRTALAARRAGP